MAYDYFGKSVAVSGDIAVIGAYNADGTVARSGSAYVYARSGTTWTQQAKLTASDGMAYDSFGEAVAVSGDIAVVGARSADGTVPDSGAAYTYSRTGSTWTQLKKLSASDGAVSDYFGQSVAAAGDTVVVGAYGDDEKGPTSGSVWVETTILEDSSFAVMGPGVLANDTDAEGDTLLAVLADEPSHGAVMFEADGSFVYTPDSNWFGADTFTYCAFDGADYSSPAIVEISVAPVNEPPSFSKGPDVVLLEDMGPFEASWATSVSAGPLETGQAVSFSVTCDNPALFSSQPTVDSYGVLRFTSAPDAVGTTTANMIITDADGATSASATMSISIVGVEDPPLALNDNHAIAEDGSIEVGVPGVLANDVDVDNDLLLAELVTEPSHGAFSFFADGAFTYAPEANWSGIDTFTYRVFDGFAYSTPATVTLSVLPVNDPPVFTKGPDITVLEDSGPSQSSWATSILGRST